MKPVQRLNQVGPENPPGSALPDSMEVSSEDEGKVPLPSTTEDEANETKQSFSRGSIGAGSTESQKSTRSSHIIHPEQQEKLNRIKASDDRMEYLYLIRPPPTKGISGWTLKGYSVSKVSMCPPGMETVVNLEQIFFSKAGKEFDAVYDRQGELQNSKYYQIFDLNDQILFYGVEILQDFNSYPFRMKNIEIAVTGPNGGIVFQISGSNTRATIKSDQTKLGTIARLGISSYFKSSCGNWNYKVLNHEGIEVCRFVKSDGYMIYLPKSKHSIGHFKASSSKKHSPSSTDPETTIADVFELTLSSKDTNPMNPTQKTLIIAAALLVYQNCIEPLKFGPNKERFKYGLIFNSVIGFICFTLTLILILALVRGKKEEKHMTCPK